MHSAGMEGAGSKKLSSVMRSAGMEAPWMPATEALTQDLGPLDPLGD